MCLRAPPHCAPGPTPVVDRTAMTSGGAYAKGAAPPRPLQYAAQAVAVLGLNSTGVSCLALGCGEQDLDIEPVLSALVLGANSGGLKIRVSAVRFCPWPPPNQFSIPKISRPGYTGDSETVLNALETPRGARTDKLVLVGVCHVADYLDEGRSVGEDRISLECEALQGALRRLWIA